MIIFDFTFSGPDVSVQDYGPGSGEVLIEDARCEGHESNILLCQHTGLGATNCSHDQDIGINCGASKCKYMYNVRLMWLKGNHKVSEW